METLSFKRHLCNLTQLAKIVADSLHRRDSVSELESGKIRGSCKGSDESAFEKGLKESES